MLTEVRYSKLSDLYHTKFLLNQQGTLVVPAPSIADQWRNQLNQAKINLETRTYHDWIKELKFEIGLEHGNTFSKSELWDYLHLVWITSGGKKHFSTFEKVFDIYTEVKGLTDHCEIFKQVLENEIKLAESTMGALSATFELNTFEDEYKVLRDIITQVNSPGFEFSRQLNFHFLGFKVLSALQIQALQEIAKKIDINIYIPKHVVESVEKNKLNDWPKWLNAEKVIELEYPTHHVKKNYKIFSIYGKSQLWKIVNVENTFLLNDENEAPLVNIGQQRDSYSIKTKCDLGLIGVDGIIAKIQSFVLGNQKRWIDVKEFVGKLYKENLKNKSNYGEIKWSQYIEKWIDAKISLRGKIIEEEFLMFDLQVLQYKIKIDSPRTFWSYQAKSSNVPRINFLEKHVFFYPLQSAALIIEDSNVKMLSNEFFNSMNEHILNSIGPRQGQEWNRIWFESLIYDFIGSSQNVDLLIDEEVFNFDEFLRSLVLLQNFVKEEVGDKKVVEFVDKITNLNQNEKFSRQLISPSSLLAFKNCPRLFYIQNMQKLPIDEKHEVLLTEAKKGQIYHEMMEKIGRDLTVAKKYLNNPSELMTELKNNKFLKIENNVEEFNEFYEILLNNLRYWSKMPFLSSDWDVEFEKNFSIEKLHMKGRADFYAYNKSIKQLVVIDFKKSKVPTNAEVLRHEHWQTSCYLSAWKNLSPESELQGVLVGYWNMGDIESSTFLSFGKFDIDIGIKIKKAGLTCSEFIEAFEENWLKTFKLLTEEKNFNPRPNKPVVCNSCFVNQVCEKGQFSYDN